MARGEDTTASTGLGERVAAPDSRIVVHDEGETVEVSVDSPVRGPGGIFAFLPTCHVTARAVAAQEPGS